MNFNSLVITLLSSMLSFIWWKFGFLRATLKGVRVYHGALVSPRAIIDGVKSIGRYAQVSSLANVGRGSYIGDYAIIHKAVIGEYCSIAPFCCIGLTEHRLDLPSLSPYELKEVYGYIGESDLKLDPVIIGRGTWLGNGSFVRQGIQVGSDVVIGAGSVVISSVPSSTVWAGVPARQIRIRSHARVLAHANLLGPI
jgi:acetyltransferase-like isoleucine patch superfamily enzyme